MKSKLIKKLLKVIWVTDQTNKPHFIYNKIIKTYADKQESL